MFEEGNAIRRRRECLTCHRRFTTFESMMLMVRKRSGAMEPFSRSKVISGVRRACQGRPVSDDDLERLAQDVEDTLHAAGTANVNSQDIGRAILVPLKRLDAVAYLRFASVYLKFDSLDDFENAIASLRAELASARGEQQPLALAIGE